MRNNNQKVISRLSGRSLKNNKMRNCFAIAAIALTCMMFTALAAMGMGISDAMQETTMREVGGRSHAGLKGVTEEQMNQVTADKRVKDYSWNVFLGMAENIVKRQYEIRLAQEKKNWRILLSNWKKAVFRKKWTISLWTLIFWMK